MSEKDLFEEVVGQKTFKDEKGLPANEHAKKLAKEKSARQKAGKLEEVFYTVRANKVLRMRVRANGVHSDYMGNAVKLKKKGQLESQIAIWKKEGSFVNEHEMDEKFSPIVEKLQGQQTNKRK